MKFEDIKSQEDLEKLLKDTRLDAIAGLSSRMEKEKTKALEELKGEYRTKEITNLLKSNKVSEGYEEFVLSKLDKNKSDEDILKDLKQVQKDFGKFFDEENTSTQPNPLTPKISIKSDNYKEDNDYKVMMGN